MNENPRSVDWGQPIALFDQSGQKQSLSIIPTRPGVYRIRAFGNDGQPVPLRRLGGDDPDGILDIGETGKGTTGTLQYRIGTFQNAVLRGTAPHAAGCKFHVYQYSQHFPLDRLRVDWVTKPSKDEARDFEKKLLRDYRSRLLDCPPLNSAH
jgi:hypothetical protein